METTTLTTKTTTRRQMWSEYESNYQKSLKAGSLVVPIVSSLVILAFVIAFICIASYIRRRQRRTDEILHNRNLQHTYATDVTTADDAVWSVGNYRDDSYFDRAVLDLPPPYPGHLNEGDSPPSYNVACNLSDNALKEDIVTDEYVPENDYRSYSDDEESPWQQTDNDYAESHSIDNQSVDDYASSRMSRSLSSNSLLSDESSLSFPATSNNLVLPSEECLRSNSSYPPEDLGSQC